jgi:predicted dehydrogenase/threonine dehydrogenase-like Zn-dependent dehydrogenase
VKQVLQNLRTGSTELANIPAPAPYMGQLVIATRRSLISAGTERMLVEFSQASLLAKAKAQPEKVRQVLEKIRTDGILPTLETVFARLGQPLPLGYCNAGVVLAVGDGVNGFAVGDRVVSNGPHAEVVCVPSNLCARIPNEVSDDEAAFTVLAAVGLQGIRLANPSLGENVVVTGMGLLGLLTAQILRANGCRVMGIDFDTGRLDLARRFGVETVDLSAHADPVAAGLTFSDGRGVDAVLITASTQSSEPVHQAAKMSRKRGRIVLVGVTGLDLSRADFYEKELTFQVSCSYGPGRYDADYEQRGQDYPFGFVRWTERRNFEAVLDLMAREQLDVTPLISRRVPLEDAPVSYRELVTDRSALGVLLTYPERADLSHTLIVKNRKATTGKQTAAGANQASATGVSPVVGVIGAGNFASLVLLPELAKKRLRLKTIASVGDPGAAIAACKFGFAQATSDYRVILDDAEINTVFVVTPHNTHAQMAAEALRAGKNVLVEKPLALSREELIRVRAAWQEAGQRQLMVGFNRRFAPLARRMKSLLAGRSQPLALIYTVNAGEIPAEHWTQDPRIGGGRIIGEACHFIDLLRFLVAHRIIGLEARMMGRSSGVTVRQDKMSIALEFADGSLGTVHYLANGSKRFPKERVEAFSEGRVLVLDNFRALTGYGWKGFHRERQWRQDKGHAAEIAAFIKRVTEGGEPLIPWAELEEVTLASFAAVERAMAPPRPLELLE